MLNWSYRIGCLQCSFTDKELIEFIQEKKRSLHLPKKSAVLVIRKQPNDEWILGGGLCISYTGTLLSETDCENVWISDVFVGNGIPSLSVSCLLTPPLSTDILMPLLKNLEARLFHNFYPCLLLIGSAAMVLHYQEFIQKLHYCPIPLLLDQVAHVRPLLLRVHRLYWEPTPQEYIAK